jgi:hypothetical protein
MKRSLITLALCVTFSLFAGAAFAQEQTPPIDPFDASPSALGVFAMNYGITGMVYGLHYNHWFDRVGFQITGGGNYMPYDGYPIMDYSVAIQGMYELLSNTFSEKLAGRLYVWGMVGHRGWLRNSSYTAPVTTTYVPGLACGVGIGVDFVLFRHFSIPIEFGYSGQFLNDVSATPSIGGGLRYRY